MAIGILRASWTIPESFTYTPKKDCDLRNMTLFRSDTELGSSKVKPLVMCDTLFWSRDAYENIIKAIASAGTRNWTTPQDAGKKITGGAAGISDPEWQTFRGVKYRATEMIGAMIVCLTYPIGGNQTPATDYLVSAAPNMLFKSNARADQKYKDHTSGDNDGTQIHSEMFFAAQLAELIRKMKAARETPQGSHQAVTGLSRGGLTCDVDMYIEKGSLCGGCSATWEKFKADHAGTSYRI